MSKCDSCKYKTAEDGWAFCDGCIHDPGLRDRFAVVTTADHIRGMKDEELAIFVAKMLADYGSGGRYTPPAELIEKIGAELLEQFRQPYESEGTP